MTDLLGEVSAMITFIEGRGWQEDGAGLYRLNDPAGYMLMTLDRAYKYELEQEAKSRS